MDIASIFTQSAERYPDHTALIFENRRWTYREWNKRVCRFAQGLADLGVRPSDRVAFYVTTSENSVTTYFACQMLGAVAVPLNFRLAAGEAAYVLQDSGARILVYGRFLTPNVLEVQKRVRSVHDYISCAYDAANVPAGHHHFDTIAEQTVDSHAPRPVPSSGDLSALVYTSGTTGRPKGVMHSHINDVAIAMNCVMEYGLRHTDVALHIAPLYHVGGMQAFFIPHMMVGGTNVVLGHYEPLKTLETIAAERVTTLFAVPTQIQEMLLHPRFKRHDIGSLRMITTGGAAIAAATMERVIEEFCPNIFNGYGMTEASLALLLHPEQALSHLGSCGKPTLITSCRVVVHAEHDDAAPDDLAAQGEIGQLLVRGPQVMYGYWNNPKETAKKLRSGWLYTGDLVSRDEEGFFTFHGRVDDLIVSGGENIYPREVEEILYRCPLVRAVAVVGLPDARWGSIVAAFIVANAPGASGRAIDEFCRASDDLADYKRPRKVVFVDALPINPTGKVMKHELLVQYRAGLQAQS
ncbi:MAG: long-chain-fatty-acid--CoA ligase [Pseudomonadota bacterium]|nr:long-chain-fatty-acid--CoA ligase [Pseudomonadota bacterium]